MMSIPIATSMPTQGDVTGQKDNCVWYCWVGDNVIPTRPALDMFMKRVRRVATTVFKMPVGYQAASGVIADARS